MAATTSAVPSAKELQAFARSAEAAARIAGKLIYDSINSRGSGNGKNGGAPDLKLLVESKGGVDLVTEVDKACEEKIIAALRKEYPAHRFVGEESTFAGTQDATADGAAVPTWYIDPVDGTTNLVHGYPFVAVSLGLAVAGEPILGVVFLPMLEEMYVAWRGGGATRNGTPIHVAGAASVGEALLMNNIGSNRSWLFVDRTLYRLKRLLHCHKLQGLRNSGSAAVNLAHVASGKLDVYYEDGVGGPWDWCAGQVLVQEAGGVVVGLRGEKVELTLGKKGKLVAGNPAVVADVVRKLKGADSRYIVRRTYDLVALFSTLFVGGRLLALLAERRRK